MAKGYWIARVNIHDPEGYKDFIVQSSPVLKKYGAKFLVRGGRFETKGGSSHRSRNIVMEFPDYATALACFESPEYQRLTTIRALYGVADLIVVEGYDGPQP